MWFEYPSSRVESRKLFYSGRWEVVLFVVTLLMKGVWKREVEVKWGGRGTAGHIHQAARTQKWRTMNSFTRDFNVPTRHEH